MPSKMKRPLWLGLLLAPLTSPVIYYAGMLLFTDPQIESGDLITIFFVVSIYALPVSYLGSIVLGIPYVLLLKAKNHLDFWWCSLGAIPLGALAYVVLMLAISSTQSIDIVLLENLWIFSVGGAMGFGIASTFCAITGIIG